MFGFFNTYDYVYYLDGIYEKNKYTKSVKIIYAFFEIQYIHYRNYTSYIGCYIYISIEYIIFIYLYMYIISVCILNIAPCYLYYITDSVSMRVLCPYLGYTPIKKISHPNITSDIWACLKIFGVLEYGSSLHISKLVTPKTTAQLSNPTTVLPDRSNNGNTSSIAVRAPTGLW
jgi:hypothetical protein